MKNLLIRILGLSIMIFVPYLLGMVCFLSNGVYYDQHRMFEVWFVGILILIFFGFIIVVGAILIPICIKEFMD